MKLAEWFLLFHNTSTFTAYQTAITYVENQDCIWRVALHLAEQITDTTAIQELINAPD